MSSENPCRWNLPKKKLILDTTICIDLFHGQLLDKATKLPYELALPDVIVHELISPPGEMFIQAGFSEIHLSGEYSEQIILLRNHYSKPSTNDLFALLLAKIDSCALITGDDALRKAANEEGVPVFGLLWFLDRLVDQEILTTKEAADALRKVLEQGSWLPKKECEARFKKWSG
jgi:predicted nucleic acid-binding protein